METKGARWRQVWRGARVVRSLSAALGDTEGTTAVPAPLIGPVCVWSGAARPGPTRLGPPRPSSLQTELSKHSLLLPTCLHLNALPHQQRQRRRRNEPIITPAATKVTGQSTDRARIVSGRDRCHQSHGALIRAARAVATTAGRRRRRRRRSQRRRTGSPFHGDQRLY